MVALFNLPIKWKISLVITGCLLSISAHAQYSGGSGTTYDPYQISTAEDLIALGETTEDYDKHFIMKADIDLSDYTFNRALIAPDTNDLEASFQGTAFGGIFDGDGHIIKNLTIKGNSFLGLFGYVLYSQIRNLGIENVSIISGDDSKYLGGLCGSFSGGIRNCYSTGSVIGGSGSYRVGGLCGSSYGGIDDCYSNCYVAGGPDSDTIGGLCGFGYSIRSCYSTGKVMGDKQTGGLVGDSRGGFGGIIDCFWDRQTSGQNTSGGGYSKTTAEMKSAATYIGWPEIWWNGDVWVIDEGNDYPRLAWENTTGSVINNDYPRQTYSGAGTINYPFEIDSPEDLICLGLRRYDWNQYIILTGSIDMSGHIYYPISTFSGSFDGRGCIISNLTIDSNTIGKRSCLGLFGYATEDAQIKNINLEHISIIGTDYSDHLGSLCGANYASISNCHSTADVIAGNHSESIAGFVGSNAGNISTCYYKGIVKGGSNSLKLAGLCGVSGGNINNCYSEGVVTSGVDSYHTGGLAGQNIGSISECHNTAMVNSLGNWIGGLVGFNEENITTSSSASVVTGDSRVGGLVGWNRGKISMSYSNSEVNGDGSVGGLVGKNSESGNIVTSYSTSMVNGNRYIGGLVGDNEHSSIVSHSYSIGPVVGSNVVGGLVGRNTYDSSISHSYSVGSVDGSSGIGGLIGHGSYGHGDVIASFWEIEASAQNNSDGGIGLTKLEMMDPLLFGLNGWANDPNWVLDAGKDYPRLAWEQTVGQVIPQPSMDWISGSGNVEDPYEVVDSYQLIVVGKVNRFQDKHYRLTADIDFAGSKITPLNYYIDEAFNGVFDGNGFSIRNLKIDMSNESYIGLFSRLSEGGVIKNLTVEDVNVTGSNYVGGIIGYNNGGTIVNCKFNGIVNGDSNAGGIVGHFVGENLATISHCHVVGTISGDYDVGGLIGINEGGTIIECDFEGSIAGGSRVGGIVGYNLDQYIEPNMYIEGQIINCHSMKSDIVGDDSVGGIAGYSANGIISACFSQNRIMGGIGVGGLVGENLFRTIANSYAAGSVTGEEGIGGVVGINGGEYEWEHGEIVNCYSVAGVAGNAYAGGLVGINKRGVIDASFWDTETSGQMNSEGGEGKMTAEMQDPSTFIKAGWDFDRPIWTIEEQDYPRLVWEWPNHIFRILIATGYDYRDPDNPNDTEYAFHFEVLTDETVEAVEFQIPIGELVEIPEIYQEEVIEGGLIKKEREYEVEDCAYGWRYHTEFDNSDSLDAYNEGNYTIIVYYDDGSQERTTVWFGIPDSSDPIPQPVQEPTFTSFVHKQVLSSPVNIEWVPPVNPEVNWTQLVLENQGIEEYIYEFDGDTTSLPESMSLSEGQWEAGLMFGIRYVQNVKGIEVWCVKVSTSDYEFTVVP